MEDNENPNYICPLTLYYMENPVLASDGHIYEKDAILKWYNTDVKHLSPMNRKILDGKFIDQIELKKEIENYLKENSILREKKDIVFDLDIVYISCVNCNKKLKIVNKEHKFYRCGNPNCKQIFTLLDSKDIIENVNHFRQNYGYRPREITYSNNNYVYNSNRNNIDDLYINDRNINLSNNRNRNKVCTIM